MTQTRVSDMTADEVVRAVNAGWAQDGKMSGTVIVELIAAAVAEEREACAKLADETAVQARAWNDDRCPEFFVPIAEGIAEVIRNRGKK